MWLAIAEGRGEGSQVDAVGNEVQSLHARDREPEPGIDASGVDPGEDRGDAGGGTVDGDFSFAVAGVAATEEFTGDVVGNAGVPEFVGILTLRVDIEIGVLDIGG